MSTMNTFIFFILLVSLFLSSTEAFKAGYRPAKCGHGGFDVRFPFRLKTHQPQHCGDQGFDLFCRNNSTMIHFPSYGDLVVKSISYETRRLNLLDPKNCVHEVFLNLNISLTPFHYYYAVKNYTYFNCSDSLGPSAKEVPCLSGSEYHVYTIKSTVPVPFPNSCRPIKTVAIPFAYSSYLADGGFGLGLTWEFPERDLAGFQSKTGWLYLAQSKVLAIAAAAAGMVLFAAALLRSIKFVYAKIVLDSLVEKENQLTEEFVGVALHKSLKASKSKLLNSCSGRVLESRI